MRRQNKIQLVGIPPVGVTIAIDHQEFVFVGTEPYVRKDGTATELLIWQAECATCAAPFFSKSLPSRFPETRRCEHHRRPGVRVNTQPLPLVEIDDRVVGDAERNSPCR